MVIFTFLYYCNMSTNISKHKLIVKMADELNNKGKCNEPSE